MESSLKKGRKISNTKLNLIISVVLTAILLFICILAPYIVPYDPNAQDLSISLSAPSSAHLFGTDKFGRDVFSRVLCGGAPSIFGSIIIVIIVTVIGVALGVAAGYFGGRVDSFISKITDIFLAFPGMVLAVAIAGMLGIGIVNAIIALVTVRWTKFARLARSKTISIKENTFIQACKVSGLSDFNIIVKHIIPNIMGEIMITVMLDIGVTMLELAGLSFLGLGVAPPTAEWGYMLNEGRSYLQTCPWIVLYPGCAIIITVMILNYLGDSIRDYLDPRYKEI
ncbi:MAG: nickel transporter permease [Intestinibacter sp.]|uniref:nickel transporter permease n=1 Tax=Intestinibacter sp. TaxID=1965304 RepID=UPI002A803BEA|nr:nickel transporter permease [Intestinibacter sp.]MDY4574472.1 nickel transporter permease [Intestinibacter sp.]